MRFTDVFIRRPVLSIVISLLITVFGLITTLSPMKVFGPMTTLGIIKQSFPIITSSEMTTFDIIFELLSIFALGETSLVATLVQREWRPLFTKPSQA